MYLSARFGGPALRCYLLCPVIENLLGDGLQVSATRSVACLSEGVHLAWLAAADVRLMDDRKDKVLGDDGCSPCFSMLLALISSNLLSLASKTGPD